MPTWTFSPYGLAPIFAGVSIINIQYNMTYKKNIGSTAKFIHELTQEEVTIAGLPFVETKGKLFVNSTSLGITISINMENIEKEVHKDGEIITDTITPNSKGPANVTSLQVKNGSVNCLIPTGYRSIPTPECNQFGYSIKCSVFFSELVNAQWYNEKNEKEFYYQTLIPMPMDGIKRFCIWDYIQIVPPDNGDRHLDIPLSGEKQVRVFSKKIHQVHYLVVESRFPCTYNEILDYTYAVSLSLGLMTTIAPFDYAFVIASEIPDFGGKIMGGMIKLRPTIKSQYRFITTDISELYENLKEKVDYDAFRPYCDKEGKLLRSHLDPMTEQDFSSLVSMLHRSKDLARSALMLIDSSMNLECLGAIYAVALETICSVLIEANKESFSDYFEKRKRDEEWISNKNKLTRPFERLVEIGHELSEEKRDELVNIRNSFLHGGVLGFSHTEYHKLQYPCMKLRCSCGILLLRYSGYKGPILNNAVEMGLEEALKNKEPLFITYDEEAAKELVEKRKKEKQKEEEEKKKKQSQDKNNTRNQGKEKAPQPTEKPEAGV